jgi:hypothetical protein
MRVVVWPETIASRVRLLRKIVQTIRDFFARSFLALALQAVRNLRSK